MARKLCSYRIVSCTLAVLATLFFIIACGSGEIKGIVGTDIDIDTAKDALKLEIEKIREEVENMSSDSPIESSSDGGDAGSSSSEDAPGGTSSEGQASSPSSPSSSAAEVPSSSSESPNAVTCKVRTTTGTQFVKFPIDGRPEIKCIEKATNNAIATLAWNDVSWTGNPAWETPPAGVYNDIHVKVLNDQEIDARCRGLEAKCEGTITITAPSSSSYVPPPPPPPLSSSPQSTPSSSSKASSSSTASSGGACGSDGKGDNCLWNGAGDCWPIKDQADRTNCGKNAWIFSGGTTGAGALCKGGTFICGKDSSPPSGGAASLGCCKWDTETKCWDIYTAKEKEDCSGGNNKFKASACPDKEGTCPTF